MVSSSDNCLEKLGSLFKDLIYIRLDKYLMALIEYLIFREGVVVFAIILELVKFCH